MNEIIVEECDEVGTWEQIIDFTEICKTGVPLSKVIASLKRLDVK
jgi:hypothetical protein